MIDTNEQGTPAGSGIRCDQILATLSDASAGPSYSVSALAVALAGCGCDSVVLTLEGWRATGAPPAMAGVDLLEFPRTRLQPFASLASSPALSRALSARAPVRDIFHTHGLWLMPNVYPARIRRSPGSTVRIVHSPRGMLGADALRYSPTKKRAMWFAMQRRALRHADCIHATAMSEHDEIRAAGLTNPVAVIPNGIALPTGTVPTGSSRTILSLGRIHPKKGLDRLIAAWAQLESDFPDWNLRIVGMDEGGYADVLRQTCATLGTRRVSVEPALHGEDKSRAFRDAALFVLPSLNENFAMTVAEALAHGVPVVSSKGAPWAGLTDRRAGWWIDNDVATLGATLRVAMMLPPEERAAMGARGRRWMADDFGWAGIGARMAQVYRWLGTGGDVPETVCLA